MYDDPPITHVHARLESVHLGATEAELVLRVPLSTLDEVRPMIGKAFVVGFMPFEAAVRGNGHFSPIT